MDTFIMIAQLLVGLSILVGLHEMGHLLAAKMFGIRVEKFSIGFGPRIVGFTYKGTEYIIAPIFLGGYVKITGIIDESMDTDHLKKEPEPWEYRAKPAWQRLIVMMGGIIVNVITGIIVFICLTFYYGDTYTPAKATEKYGVTVGSIGKEIGLKDGDKILKVNGESVEKFSEFRSKIITERDCFYTIERDGKEMTVKVPNSMLNKLVSMKGVNPLFSPRFPYEVNKVKKKTPAAKAGLKKGDKILTINDQTTLLFDQLSPVLKENKGKEVRIQVERNGEQKTLTAKLDSTGTLGFYPESLLEEKQVQYSLGASISLGTFKAFDVIYQQIKVFGRIFKNDASASKSLSGPIGIAKFFGTEWIAQRFWTLVGLLSMVLAFMNFLPIPALDGGHVMFLTYEIISGRSPSERFLIIAQNIGMVLLLGLMAFAIINDVIKLF
ncbi:RIP metalloprotease RseP [Microscilla marina]|uniref:Zinc metalloprotease n=1 Tax=Microscilla marina ATCC 23134 TaxID=313606 RepID=A1ZLR9_MICM2|nr:RIP metalloprotease RseP [Microscilla marina]EAY28823.1 membrane-associated zinc metalloprotease, putative [Microscilla marina ATCC 23134]